MTPVEVKEALVVQVNNNIKHKLMKRIILVLLLSVLMFSCKSEDYKLRIYDRLADEPIYDALVYSKDHKKAFSSDYDGYVTLPSSYKGLNISIDAYDYKSKTISLEKSGDIVMEVTNPTKAGQSQFSDEDKVMGLYNEYRKNNDITYYDLSINVDAENKRIDGVNKISFRALTNLKTIQIDLHTDLEVKDITHNNTKLKYTRKYNAVLISFPEPLVKDSTYTIDFNYGGMPKTGGRFGGFTFDKDVNDKPWIYTATQFSGANVWWPNKEQLKDEVEGMVLRITVNKDLVCVANGKLMDLKDINEHTHEYTWQINYSINNYCVALNIGDYTHFNDRLGDTELDYYVKPENLEKAKEQFKQASDVIRVYEKYFGEYPYKKDGYKLIEVPYAGMEHQSAIAYGNGYKNGYLSEDWTGTDIGFNFDFIIVHETAHEWFGNSITANNYSDVWIHEAWATYAESVYVEETLGYDKAMQYLNGYRGQVYHQNIIWGKAGKGKYPDRDMYFKGALFINTLRHIVNDDAKWWKFIYDYSTHFKYQNISTVDVLNYFNSKLDIDFKPYFDQYLRTVNIPEFESKVKEGYCYLKWSNSVYGFDLPADVSVDGGDMTKAQLNSKEFTKHNHKANDNSIITIDKTKHFVN